MAQKLYSIMTLEDLNNCFRPNFIWDRTGKPLTTSEEDEGSKDLARMIYVGVSDMLGFQSRDVCRHLDMSYESYRVKLQKFKGLYNSTDKDFVKRKFDVKLGLVRNAIMYVHKSDYVTLKDWVYVS